MSDEIRALARRCGDLVAAAPEAFPAQALQEVQRAGIIAAPFAAEHGGRGWSLADAVGTVETFAAASPSVALLLSMPLGLAGVHAVGLDVAPPEHRDLWADRVDALAADYRAGAIYAACNSEKGAGGSLDQTRTVARRTGDGVFQLTGEKILASWGTHATHFFSTARVDQGDLPGAGVVEFFFVETQARGVRIGTDWDGFGMRPTESHSVHYADAPAAAVMGFPDFIAQVQPLQYWFCLFAAIPLGCARGLLEEMGSAASESAGRRLRLNDALMRYESLRAYLQETARDWRPGRNPATAARVLRTKTFVSQEAVRLCADLFALGGGRHYRRGGRAAGLLADAFAGTALRPPLALAVDQLSEQFELM